MKILLFAAVISTAPLTGKGQSGNRFSIGFEAGGSMGKFNDMGYRYGFGGSVQGMHTVAPHLDLTLQTGYINHGNKRIANTNFYAIPVLAGVKYWLSRGVFL